MIDPDKIDRIVLPRAAWWEIVDHCTRKLDGNYLEGETREHKAYGLVAGTRKKKTLRITRVLPAKRNVRSEEPYRTYIDQIVERYGVPLEMPASQRGWVMDAGETKELYDRCEREGLEMIGIYHMHRTPWKDDPLRDTPTLLDGALAEKSGLYSFIVSMIDRNRPRIRAFYEAIPEKEVPIHVEE
jgi:hypothetical protein